MSKVTGERFEVEDLDADDVLAFLRDLDLEARRIDAWKLRAAAHWADLHPATTDTGAAAPDGNVLDPDETLGGDGTPAVAAFTPEELGVVLRVSPSSATALVADALDLRHRLPLLWKQVMRCEIEAWLARRVAQQTRSLTRAGAAYVDDTLAARTTGWGTGILDRVVAQAIARFDPAAQEKREDNAKAGWDVTLSHPGPTDFAGTGDLNVRGDTLTLKAFYDLVCAIAHQLDLDGDTDSPGVRKAKAIGLVTALASGQASLDLGSVLGRTSMGSGKVKVYVRVDADDLDADATGGSAFAVGEIEKLGAATLTKIRHWVGHHQVVIQPVLNMQRGDAVDVHDPPLWMRELVILRDGHCVFPGCTRDARTCDLDHIVAYDKDGPPGQTHPGNLACICRRHHRAKTAGRWRYRRTPNGDYAWTSPRGTTYLTRI